MEILLTIVFVFVGIGAFAFGMEHMNFPDLGIIVETAVIGGVILWRMRKNNKKQDSSSGSIKVRCFFTLIPSINKGKHACPCQSMVISLKIKIGVKKSARSH